MTFPRQTGASQWNSSLENISYGLSRHSFSLKSGSGLNLDFEFLSIISLNDIPWVVMIPWFDLVLFSQFVSGTHAWYLQLFIGIVKEDDKGFLRYYLVLLFH